MVNGGTDHLRTLLTTSCRHEELSPFAADHDGPPGVGPIVLVGGIIRGRLWDLLPPRKGLASSVFPGADHWFALEVP